MPLNQNGRAILAIPVDSPYETPTAPAEQPRPTGAPAPTPRWGVFVRNGAVEVVNVAQEDAIDKLRARLRRERLLLERHVDQKMLAHFRAMFPNRDR